jgi:KUP system potassium uptake protein
VRGRRLAALSLAALGVVYGDIGTSPLYALRECFNPAHGLPPTPEAVLGVLSLVLWALLVVVTVKYVLFVVRLDNRGEGGIMALLALVLATRRTRRRPHRTLVAGLALFGAALLYGDGVITPAISVLGAVEGLEVAAPALGGHAAPLAVAILLALFALQRRGTARVGALFGPVMLAWFVTIAALGVGGIARAPEVLAAVNPAHGGRLLVEHGWAGFLVLGAVVLAVTGAEALYADLGHFGARPIRLVWLGLVLPALVLNYLGQGALILRQPDAAPSPFYLLAPPWFRAPLLLIATLAAVIASQALISGAFSLTQQAIQLRYVPRMAIVHTSREEVGQVFLPLVNGLLAAGAVAVVLGFGSSSALSAAYGIAVTGTMAVTTVLLYVMARDRWEWPRWRAGLVAGLFLVVDAAFLGANLVKVEHGGWVPLVLAAGLWVVMDTWNRGARLVTRRLDGAAVPLDEFIAAVRRGRPPRVPGTAVFLTHDVTGAPLVLQHHLRHNKVLHERVVLLAVLVEEVPVVAEASRVESEALPEGFFRVRARIGFMERASVPAIVRRCCRDLRVDPGEVTYVMGRARLVPTGPTPMVRWRKRLFAFMARNAAAAPDFFAIPPSQVVELGARIEF